MANAWSHTCMSHHHRHPPTEEGGHKRRWTSFVEPPGEDSLKQARTRVLRFWRPLRFKRVQKTETNIEITLSFGMERNKN